jgi:hypothetical protein
VNYSILGRIIHGFARQGSAECWRCGRRGGCGALRIGAIYALEDKGTLVELMLVLTTLNTVLKLAGR